MSEETRAEAYRIVVEWADAHQVTEVGPGTKSRLVDAIDKALQARDERAAKIAEGFAGSEPWYDTHASEVGEAEAIAAAIRSRADVSQ